MLAAPRLAGVGLADVLIVASPAVVHAVQPEIGLCAQAPASHVSVVQAF